MHQETHQFTKMAQSGRIAVVDLQGFTVKNQYVVKELFYSTFDYNEETGKCGNNLDRHFIFEPPFKWSELDKEDRTNALRLQGFHHGLYWHDGTDPLSEFNSWTWFLTEKNLVIYVKGFREVKWFKSLFKNHEQLDVRNVEDFGYNTRLSRKYDVDNELHCRKHKTNRHCARQNALNIKNWLRVQPKLEKYLNI